MGGPLGAWRIDGYKALTKVECKMSIGMLRTHQKRDYEENHDRKTIRFYKEPKSFT